MNKVHIIFLTFLTLILGGVLVLITLPKPSIHAFQHLAHSQIILKVDPTKIEAKLRKDAKIVMFGDMIFEGPLFEMVSKKQNPFQKVKKYFDRFDLVVGNMETTIDGKSVGEPQPGKAYTFSAPKNLPQILLDAGIDVVGYANNHTKDFGPNSVTHTIDLLNKAGIKNFGAGKNSEEAFKTLAVNVNGNKIGFFGINSAEYLFNISSATSPGTAYFNENLTRNAIAEGAKKTDILIVFAHWGDERSPDPNDFQKLWAKKFIDMGADLVVGAHPHVRQGTEEYQGKKIYYSLGNFMFPGVTFMESRKGYVLEIQVDRKKITKTTVRNIEIDEYGVPSLVK